jgi:cohesin complex subunit SA-1/2
VRAIGLWFQKYPGHFLDASYLRYVGWVLSDSATPVRLEAVKALSGVYAQADYIGSLNHFTERFKPRLIEMAAGDTELTVRVAVIQVLEAIEGHSLLEDDEREKLCLLVFDEEAKIRKAVSGFVRGVWEEHVDERLAGRKASEKDKTMAGAKALAVLLVKWGNSLDKVVGGDAEEDDSVGETGEGVGPSRVSGSIETTTWAGFRSRKGRIAFAVEALWDDVEPVRDWEGLLDVLLLDHSTVREGGAEGSSRPRSKRKANADDDMVDEAWRLEEEEETVLIEVLVAAIHHAKLVAVSGKKVRDSSIYLRLHVLNSPFQGDESVANDITRALIKALPSLFIKHQTDQKRITNILILPTLMNLDLYLEMRIIPVRYLVFNMKHVTHFAKGLC